MTASHSSFIEVPSTGLQGVCVGVGVGVCMLINVLFMVKRHYNMGDTESKRFTQFPFCWHLR